MKGLILAGGYGIRVRPCSYYLNKHMIPIFDRPLIEYAVEALVWVDITEIGIVLGGSHPNQIKDYLGNGARYGVKFTYVWQGAPRGIAQAINSAKDFVGKEKFIVHLADNVLEDPLADVTAVFKNEGDCLVVLYEGSEADVKKSGCAEFKDDKLVRIIEKPDKLVSNFAQVGVYGLNSYFFEVFKTLKPSWRGEYEQVDVINRYLKEGKDVKVTFLRGKWFDCGDFTSILNASQFMHKKRLRREKRVES